MQLEFHDPNTLYWCEDTKELFKGNDLYTDGVRFGVDDVMSLQQAALGVLYMQSDGNGFTWDGNSWKHLIFPNTTLIDKASTDEQIPTAKAVYTAIQNAKLGESNSTDTSGFITKNEFNKLKKQVDNIDKYMTWGII